MNSEQRNVMRDTMNDDVSSGEIQQEACTVNAELFLAQLSLVVGEEFIAIPTAGWMLFIQTLQEWEEEEDHGDETLSERLEKLQIPIMPVSLTRKEDERRILTPDDIRGESRIITP